MICGGYFYSVPVLPGEALEKASLRSRPYRRPHALQAFALGKYDLQAQCF